MEQVITVKLKLYNPTRAKQEIYQRMADRCTSFANDCLGLDKNAWPKTSEQAAVYADLPSAVLNQAIRDIKSRDNAKVFKCLWPGFNNQNFRVEKEVFQGGGAVWKVSFPTLEKRVGVPVEVSMYQSGRLGLLLSGAAKQGAAYLIKKRGKWYIHLSMTIRVEKSKAEAGATMGIDLGLICLLVAFVSGRTFFVHGGPLAYIRRRFAGLRRELQVAGAHRALKKLADREHRWVTDMNHKISRAVVNFALASGVSHIRMEDLTGVRWTRNQNRSQRRDHGRSLHCWSFYQLQKFVEYKAVLAGIEVEYVDRDGTSVACSRCGAPVKRPSGRMLICPGCFARLHVDANAAANISRAISGLAA
jgi:IS605 OrfB family transposase